MKAFRNAVTLVEYEATEAKRSQDAPRNLQCGRPYTRNCAVKHPERRGRKISLKHQHLKSVTEISGRFKEYPKSTKSAAEKLEG